MQATWNGSPDGPNEITMWNMKFKKGEATEVTDPVYAGKLARHQEFTTTGEVPKPQLVPASVVYRSATEISALGPVPKPGERIDQRPPEPEVEPPEKAAAEPPKPEPPKPHGIARPHRR